MTQIQVLNANNETVRTIQLDKSVTDHISNFGYSIYTLNDVIVKDTVGNIDQEYRFSYYPTVGGSNIDLRHRDWWGYYNASGTPYLVPKYTVPYTGSSTSYTLGSSSAYREPDLSSLESGVLKAIKYPTGGSTEFTYENNKYYSDKNSQIKNGPGIRIGQIKNTDSSGRIEIKTFKYGENEEGYGQLDMEPDITNMAEEYFYQYYPTTGTIYPDASGSYRQRCFYSDFIPALEALSERPIVYTEVTEYNGTPTDNTGKTIYDYSYYRWGPSAMDIEGQTIPILHIFNYNYWDNPELIQKTIYKSVPAGSSNIYLPVEKIINNYQNTSTDTIMGLHVRHLYIFPQDNYPRGNYTPLLACEPFGVVKQGIDAYTFGSYQIIAGYKNLSSTIDSMFNDDGSAIVNATSYNYNTRQLTNKITKSQSDGSNDITNLTYPFDYTGNSALTTMVNSNMLNYIIEQSDLKNTFPVKSIRTNYFNWGTINPMIAPQTVDLKKGSGAYETRLRYLAYDNGHPVSVSKENDKTISYIWDYQRALPVAEVQNASSSEIAFTSFEADGNGNWSGIVTGNRVSSPNSITGTKYYNLNGAGLTKSGLSASKSYIVSYWSTAGSYSVSGTSSGWPKSLRSVVINGVTWTYWEHHIAGVSTVSVSGSGNIDELRLYPTNGEMTSFTYKPLVGILTVDDAASSISYYEYDGTGRLKDIKDQNDNILKTYKYQMSN